MASSQSQTRADNLKRRLRDAGIPFTVRRDRRDGMTRVWRIEGRTMGTGQAERYVTEREQR